MVGETRFQSAAVQVVLTRKPGYQNQLKFSYVANLFSFESPDLKQQYSVVLTSIYPGLQKKLRQILALKKSSLPQSKS